MTTAKIERMSDDELRDFVRDYLAGQIFTSANISPGDDQIIAMIFMPLAMGALADFSEDDLRTVGCLWAYTKDAAPMAINGYPSFFAMHVMHAEDWERAHAAIAREQERLDRIEV